MIDSVNSTYSNYNQKIAFKAQNDSKDASQVTTQNSYKNPNTHYGLITGGSLFVLTNLLPCCITRKLPKLSMALKGAATALGCGAITDFIINKKKNAFNEKIKSGDKKNLKNASVSKNGNIYYHSNDGKKYGSLLGAVLGVVTTLPTKNKHMKLLPSVIVSSIGGLILGSITDKLTNKRTIKDIDANT